MKYFQTSDKKLFYVEDLARNHARSLEDKTVKKVDSADLKAEPKTKESKTNDEREQLVVRFEELFGKKPNHNIGVEKLKTQIQEKESELASNSEELKENLETEVNQDKSKGSDVDTTQKVGKQEQEETKTDK